MHLRLTGFTIVAALAACTGADKDDAKGQVDESAPPNVPTQVGKADDNGHRIAIDVQSPHPYTNHLNRVFPVSLTPLPWCATSARLHFKVLRTEANYDYVTVEPSGAPVEEFTGTHDDTWSEWFATQTATVNVRLDTDGSVTRHGFEIDQLEWEGVLPCPNAPTTCDPGEVNLTARPGVCQCEGPALCEPVANVDVSHQLVRGRNNTTQRVQGTVATYTYPGPTDALQTRTIGSVDPQQLADLVRRAAETGLLQGAGYELPVIPGQHYEAFVVQAGTYRAVFVAPIGTQTPEVQALIDDFAALFLCESGGGLSCGTGYTCDAGTCIEEQTCVCPAHYDPVCGTNGHTYSNGCAAGCANMPVAHAGECGITGDTCGTLLGLGCQPDYRCRYAASTFTAPWPDAGGTCVAANYCDAPVDCNGLIHVALPGAWACQTNQCAWITGPLWQPVTAGHFETPNPYSNNVSVWHQLYLPPQAQALRLATTRFRTEAGYDKLEVWTWKNGAWTKVRTFSGTIGPSLIDEFPGVYHYVRFTSDSSVTSQGVALDAQWR